MLKEIRPFSYHGSIRVPCSKSYLQRAIAICCLTNESSNIYGFTTSNDAEVALEIAERLGAEINLEENGVSILGGAKIVKDAVSINCGEAGLSTRMYSPIAASLFQDVQVTGSGSILSRPMNMVIDALKQLGARVDSNNGSLPLRIRDGIKNGEIFIDGSESSQLLTGLLIALPTLMGDSIIHVRALRSVPYVQMTLDILSSFDVKIEHEAFNTFWIKGNQKPKGSNYYIEGDWSGAAFHIVGAAISGEVELVGLNVESSQADREILNVVEMAGAKVIKDVNSIKVLKGKLNSFEFDATNCPDLFPPLAALATCCDGISRIEGINRLKHKESNRALTIKRELKKLGIQVDLVGNSMKITGGTISGGKVSSNNDHRIAMMTAILGSVSNKSIVIEDSEAIDKSYPQFYSDLPKV